MAKSSIQSKAKPVPSDRLRGLSPRVAALLGDVERSLDRSDLAGAERALTGALALAANHPETLRLAALLQQRRGRLADAEATCLRALALRPDDAMLVAQLGELKAAAGDHDAAFALLRRATDLAPGDAGIRLRLGIALDAQGMNDEALLVARRVLEIDPKHRLGRLLLARSLQALGHIDETAREYRRLIADGGPQAYQAWFSLVDLKTIRLEPREIAELKRLESDLRLGDDARAALGFALGKALEDTERHADAFAAFRRANTIKRRSETWNAAAFSREVDAMREAFSGPLAGAPADLGREVIFVVGLPRSSTTLFEQILAAHADVNGASELPDLPAVIARESQRRGAPLSRWVREASAADWERLGREYLARTARWRRDRARSTDKLPGNWLLAGAALAMLPGAKIIDSRRDPLETCWSCYKQMFAPRLVPYGYDLGELASYWRDYDRLGRFWVERYPGSVRAQRYEALLEDPEREIRALLEFCDLPFDASCLAFHEARRSVRSASAAQVRQPLRRDTARAARYGTLLDPLRNALSAGS